MLLTRCTGLRLVNLLHKLEIGGWFVIVDLVWGEDTKGEGLVVIVNGLRIIIALYTLVLVCCSGTMTVRMK